MKHHTKCLISNTEDLSPLKGYEEHYLVKSSGTGFVFSSRIPTEEELIMHYNGYPRNDTISPITVNRYKEYLEQMEPYRKHNRILDVGCGNGHFLKVAKEKGWEVHGTEFTDEAIRFCENKGILMQKGALKDANFESNFFDVIVSFEVIEHIYNPIEEVQKMNQLLRKGGLFFFTTPNFNAVERYVLKSKYNVIEYPEHLSYYTPKTIDYLLSNNGYKKLKITTTGISISRIRKSLNNDSSDAISGAESSDETIRNIAENNILVKFVKNTLNTLLTTLGIGNSLKGYYIKE